MMTTFARRQQILTLLNEQKSVKVTELAKILDVSVGTIRNDLNALEDSPQLMRVRGGAVLKENGDAASGDVLLTSPDYPQPMTPVAAVAQQPANAIIKQRIARWAADLVENGDSILLDSSNTVFFMASFLENRQHLTVITNGIEVARALAKNPSNTVILIGGILHPDGTAIINHLGEKFLHDLHIGAAFVSCSGFSLENGLTEVNIHEAQLKSAMIASAEKVFALVDSSKFGQARLTPYATPNQITRIFTDNNIDQKFVDRLRQSNVGVTICGENTTSSYNPMEAEEPHYKIGFANLSEDIPFAIDVRRSLERAAKKAGNIDLIIGDNRLSGENALNISDRLINKQVDLVIEYQIDQKIGSLLMSRYQSASTPVIAVDIPMVGATYFGVDNYKSGYMAGVALGEWVKFYWEGNVDRLLVLEEPRAGDLPAARIQGQIEGLQSVVGEITEEQKVFLDSGNTSETSEAQVTKALNNFSDEHKLAVISFNDDAAYGALKAARQLSREDDVVIVGQGADRKVRPEIRDPNSRIIGSTAFMPEKYGDKLILIAQKILRGESVPPATFIDHTFISINNVDLFYPEQETKTIER